MIGKLLIGAIVPGIVVAYITWWAVKVWYFKSFGKSIDEANKLDKQSKKYDKKMGK